LGVENSIYIVKGKSQSTLINLKTFELRSISNQELDLLDASLDLEEDISKLAIYQPSVCEKEILDIKISTTHVPFKLSTYIKEGMSYHNIRIICPSEKEVSFDIIENLIDQINTTIFHFGIIILIPKSYNKETYTNHFGNCKILTSTPANTENTLYQPNFYVTPGAITISKNNNLFHYLRDTLIINEREIKLIDHDAFNIPKHKIENCKDCGFRLTCYDSRKVYESDGKYYYNTNCKYEEDQLK